MPATPSRTHRRSLHDYRILQPLGSGPSGEVFRARDLINGGDVALKRFSTHVATAEGLSRYAESAAVAADIPGTTACRLIELVPDPAQAFAVLEYIPGRDLGEYLRHTGPLAWPAARDLFGRCAAALCAAHRADLVHGALKPSNIRVIVVPDAAPMPRLLDFGIAAMRPLVEPGATRVYEARAIEYQAPEQLLGLPAIAASDLYSLGVMLFEALTGHPPFKGRPQEVAQHHLRSTPPSPRIFTPDLPAAAETVVRALLAKAPDARQAGLDALLAPPQAVAPYVEDDLQTMTWDRSALLAVPPPERRPGRPVVTTETVVLPVMPPASAAGDGVTVIIEGMNREFLLEPAAASDAPMEQTSVHTHADATVFITRMPTAAPAHRPRPGWRRRLGEVWTMERKLIALNVGFGVLILGALLLLALR